MKKYIIVVLLLVLTQSVMANTLSTTLIKGNIVSKKTGERLEDVTVSLQGTTIGTITDVNGNYKLKNVPKGKVILFVKSLGYKVEKKELLIKKGTQQIINFALVQSSLALDQVVVSATRNATSERLAPELVSILNTKTFDRTNSVNLAGGLKFQPGLRVEDNCQNCAITQVRMNGLEGAYSQILIDSRPTFGALDGSFGLEQIPSSMIDHVEVVRGGGSALFGSSAIAGTINVITKDPTHNSAELSHNIMSIGGKGNWDNTTNVNTSIVSNNHKMGIALFGQRRSRDGYDADGDGFSELPELNNTTLGFRSYLNTSNYSKITLEYHNLHEFRRGGDHFELQPFRSSLTEQVESHIDGGSLKYDIHTPDSKQHISLYAAAQNTRQDSYFGGGEPYKDLTGNETPEERDHIIANNKDRLNDYGLTKDLTFNVGGQYSYDFSKLLFMPSQLMAGIEYSHDNLDDNSGYRVNAFEQKVNIKSIFAQNEWKNDKWSFLIGARLDKHNLLKHAIISPRANIRYNPTPDINIRLTYAKGFRAPQMYDEDLHTDIAHGKDIVSVLDPKLKEETSHSLSGSVNWYHTIDNVELNFLIEGFYTKLLDPFTSIQNDLPDGRIIKTIQNTTGAQVYGSTFEAKAALNSLLDFQLGLTLQKSLYDKAQKWSGDANDDVKSTRKMMRTPNVYGYFVATVNPVKHFSTSLSSTYTGSMLVPHQSGYIKVNKTETTPDFFELNWRVSYTFPLYKKYSLELNGGVQNILNAYQKDFDQTADRADEYIYGPSLPRSYYLGAKVSF